MKTLYLRIYLTVLAVLAAFALVGGGLAKLKLDEERERFDQERSRYEQNASDRTLAWAELIQAVLPPDEAPEVEQAAALVSWSERLRLPMALDRADGVRVVTTPLFERLDALRQRAELPPREDRGPVRLSLRDGRSLWIWRPPRPLREALGLPGGGPREGPPGADRPAGYGPGGGPGFGPPPPPRLFGGLPLLDGRGLLIALGLLFVAIAAGAYPVVRRLTRRLEALKAGVEAFGAGQLRRRVEAQGRDEVAALGQSFNEAADRIEGLIDAHRSLLANASHELRSPLARLKMALALAEEAGPERAASLREEARRNIAELDALVEEVLLASRLDARPEPQREPLDPLALATEMAAETDAVLDDSAWDLVPAGTEAPLRGDERLLRRALRNLLENARRYGGSAPPELGLGREAGAIRFWVADRGPGVPAAERERIFEPFYRLPGHAERAGGVGLGLSLVRQIARLHGGSVVCEGREGGGSRFVLRLPAAG